MDTSPQVGHGHVLSRRQEAAHRLCRLLVGSLLHRFVPGHGEPQGQNLLPGDIHAPRTMSNASISPLLVWGQASTGQAPSTFMAFTVSSSGSPGPTPTP